MNVSIVIATHNGQLYLKEQLASIIKQTNHPFEIVASDDASTDSTLEILEDFANKAPFPVRIIANTTALGYADNFLSACEFATGDIIALCDQDDVWKSNKIEIVSGIFRNHSISMVIHSSDVVDNTLNPLNCRHIEIARSRIIPPGESALQLRPPGFCMTFKKSLVTNHDWRTRPIDLDFINSQSKHDTWLYALANAEGGIYFLRESLALYRRHASNSSHFRNGNSIQRRLGQWKTLLNKPNQFALANNSKSLLEHSIYFKNMSCHNTQFQSNYKYLSTKYYDAFKLQENKIANISNSRLSRLKNIIQNLRLKKYGRLIYFNRRKFAEDLFSIFW